MEPASVDIYVFVQMLLGVTELNKGELSFGIEKLGVELGYKVCPVAYYIWLQVDVLGVRLVCHRF